MCPCPAAPHSGTKRRAFPTTAVGFPPEPYDNTSLHQVWDSGLISRGYHDETTLSRKLEDLTRKSTVGHWLTGRVEDWTDESLELGRRAYLVPGSLVILRPGDTLGGDYERENLPLAVGRLARSGVRLADMLNDILK